MVNISKFKDATKFPSFQLIEANFDFFFTQLMNEKEIPESKLNECLNSICSITASTKDEYQSQCNIQYFYKNKLQGSPCTNLSTLNPFVRTHDKSDFLMWICEITGLTVYNTRAKIGEIIYAPNSRIRNILLNSFLNNLAISTTYSTESNCYKYFGLNKWKAKNPPKLRDAYISAYYSIHWSIPDPTTEDIFYNQTVIENIPCRSGILGNNKKIIFKHTLNNNYNVRKPTILDAGFYEPFKPGGKTVPLTRCNHLSGFDEYVHIPNQFFNLKDSIYETFK